MTEDGEDLRLKPRQEPPLGGEASAVRSPSEAWTFAKSLRIPSYLGACQESLGIPRHVLCIPLE